MIGGTGLPAAGEGRICQAFKPVFHGRIVIGAGGGGHGNAGRAGGCWGNPPDRLGRRRCEVIFKKGLKGVVGIDNHCGSSGKGVGYLARFYGCTSPLDKTIGALCRSGNRNGCPFAESECALPRGGDRAAGRRGKSQRMLCADKSGQREGTDGAGRQDQRPAGIAAYADAVFCLCGSIGRSAGNRKVGKSRRDRNRSGRAGIEQDHCQTPGIRADISRTSHQRRIGRGVYALPAGMNKGRKMLEAVIIGIDCIGSG